MPARSPDAANAAWLRLVARAAGADGAWWQGPEGDPPEVYGVTPEASTILAARAGDVAAGGAWAVVGLPRGEGLLGLTSRSGALDPDLARDALADGAATRRGIADAEHAAREARHRSMNDFQAVSSLLQLQARRAADPTWRRRLEDAALRVRSMTVVRSRLRRDGADVDVDAMLRDVAAASVRACGGAPGLSVTVDADAVALDGERASTLGQIANELVTNALRHAFPGGRAGLVRVSLRATDDLLALEVADGGVGFDPDAPTEGIGLRVAQLLARQLKATLRVSRVDGTRARVELPRAVAGVA